MSTSSGSDNGVKVKPLSNSNYQEWSGEAKAYLMRLGLWRLVAGRESKPSVAAELTKWEAKAEKAAGEIYLLVEADQRIHIRGLEDDPVGMWAAIEKAHLSKKPGARFNAYDDLFSIHKEDNEGLIDLGVRISKAMANIQNLRPTGFTIEQLDEELQCMALIRALPDEYKHLSASLLLMEKLDKDTILQAFRSEELNRQRQTEQANRAGHKGYGKRGGANSGKGRGHPTVDADTCSFCKGKGHWKRDCEALKKVNASNKDSGSGGSNAKVAAEKADAVAEFAGQASARLIDEACATFSNDTHWNTDTGATSHMTPHKEWIRNYTTYRVPIRLADHTIVYSEGVGDVLFRPVINGRQVRDVLITRVLYVPALCNNLLAVLYLTRNKGFNVHITKDKMEFVRNDVLLFCATISNAGIGYLDGSTIDTNEFVHVASTLPLDLTLWHRRLGHQHHEGIKQMIKDEMVIGLTLDSSAKPDPVCTPCLTGKMHANPFPSSSNRADELLALVHSDVHYVGIDSHSGQKYWVTFIDDYSKLKVVIPLKLKSEVFNAFKRFKAWAENQTGKHIKVFRCDQGGEFMSKEFDKYLEEHGIERQFSVRNRPQQNGVAERANRLLSERITAMLDESGLSKAFWAECLAALVHVLNRCITSSVAHATPYEVWHR